MFKDFSQKYSILKCDMDDLISKIMYLCRTLSIENLAFLWEELTDDKTNLNKYIMNKTDYLVFMLQKAKKEVKMKFIDVSIGAYFTMAKGLLWRKLNNAEAVDVWSGRIIRVKPTTKCNVPSKEN